MTGWVPTQEAKYAVAIYNFPGTGTHELVLSVGDAVQITEECAGWYRGSQTRNRQQKGIFPKSYVHIKEVESIGEIHSERVKPKETPIIQELTAVLREWCVLWKQLYVKRDLEKYNLVHKMLVELIDYRRQMISGTLPVDEIKEMKQHVTAKIDFTNRQLGLDLVIRDEEGSVQNPTQLSSVSLHRMHEVATQRIIGQQETSFLLRTKKQSTVYSYNLYVMVKNVVCKIGENADVLMSLYDGKLFQHISEAYVVKWSSKGTPTDLSLLHNLKTIFTDLGAKDLQRDKIFLVCQIIRIGRMELKEGDHSKKYTTGLRRPWGVAAMEITDIVSGKMDTDDDKQYFIPFQPCPSDDSLDSVIRRFVQAKEVNHKGQGIWVTLKMLHGEVKQVYKEYPHLLDSKTAVSRKMGFPEVIMPGDVRNDVYITLLQGDFDRGTRPKARNVEVNVSVCTEEGKVLQNAICTASGEPPASTYRSVVYYQVKNPKYHEIFKVAIPIDQFCQPNTHVRFTFRHRSATEAKDKQEKYFAMAYLKLMTDIGTTITNGTHELVIYKCDKNMESSTAYLNMPSTRNELKAYEEKHQSHASQHQKGLTISSKDTFVLSTVVCSTKLTQNVDLLGLLKWRAEPDSIRQSLEYLMKVDGEEVVKFLQDTLDALFSIMAENPQSEEYDKPVFNAVMFIIGLIADRKYQQFRPVLDTYINEHYSVTFADHKLAKVLKDYLDSANEEDGPTQLLQALKAIEYLFKFILRSRKLFVALHGEATGKQGFESSMREVFRSLNWLMTYTDDRIVLCQGAAMRFLPHIIQDMMTQFNPKELAIHLKEFILNLPPDRLVKQKLECLRDFVQSDIFQVRECRAVLLPMMSNQLQVLIEKREEMKSCAELFSEILDTLWQPKTKCTHGDTSELMHTLLRTLIQAVIHMFLNNEEKLIGKYVALMIGLLRQMGDYHYQEYINNFPTRTDLTDFLMEIFCVFKDLVTKNVFPSDWSMMILQQNNVILLAMKQFARVLHRSFVKIEEFEFDLWNNFFHLAVSFVTHESLQLEGHLQSKRNSVIDMYGDMRRTVAFEIIRTMWNYLGKNKIKFIPGMIGPFLEVALVPEVELRRATIPIFYDMINCEFSIKNNFKMFEREIIGQLDALVEGGRGDEQFKDIFKEILVDFCEKHQYLRESGVNFVIMVAKLLDRLLNYRAIMHTDNKENRMSCIVNLLNFYKDIDRQDMYTRYLYKLCDLHLECDNYTEAAFTLQLQADRQKWTDTPLYITSEKYPDAVTERQLKEVLYYDIIEFFDKGKMWERGISRCKELCNQYERETFDYVQLSVILRRQADLYDNIMKQPRPAPEYFKVWYIGQGFPAFLRNRVFIYRGKEYERLADFVARQQQLYPNATLLNKTTPPDKELFDNKGQILQIVPVQPKRDNKKEFRGKNISEQILSYYSVNEVQKFTYSRPFHKEQKDRDNEFKTMWIERTHFSTEYKLPGILRWFEVTDTFTEELSPIQNAIENMEDVNRKLRALIIQHEEDPNLPINPLSLQLNGVIDSAVMGGPVMYERAFCVEEYITKHPEDVIHITRLKELFAEQIPLVELGLTLHRNKMSDDLRPFQQKMEAQFQKRRQIVEERYGKKLIENFALTPNDKLIQSFARRHSRGQTYSGRPLSVTSTSSTSSDTQGSRSSIISNPEKDFLSVQQKLTNKHRSLSNQSISSKTSDKHKDKGQGSPSRSSPAKIHRNSRDLSNEDLGLAASTPSKEAPKPIILDEKSYMPLFQQGFSLRRRRKQSDSSLSSARPLRKDMKKANHVPMQRPIRARTMHVMNTSSSTSSLQSSDGDNDAPPKLPPKQSSGDFTQVEVIDHNNPPPKPAGFPIALSSHRDKEQAPPPLPVKGSSSTTPPISRKNPQPSEQAQDAFTNEPPEKP
ncbi:dedicator of cytokinesis protein 1-like [Diadema antillarum]|uniref:dedicator of cytokinesis protein 1-like n=2 Tax=Diadema antillarum TaxID=105358 RepID=UPI003A841D96